MRNATCALIAILLAGCGAEPAPTELVEAEPPAAANLAVDTPIGEPLVVDTPPERRELPPVDEVVDSGTQSVIFAYEVDVDAGVEFLALVNEERASRGLSELLVYWDIEDDAHAQTERMIDAGQIFHNPNLGQVTGPVWSKLGENVGVGGTVQTLHQAFMNSPGHKANVLGADYTHVGIGAQRNNGVLWVTFVFMEASVPNLEQTFGPFVDDDFNTHEAGISKIAAAGITVGCDSTGRRYCPQNPVTRGQMATFLKRAFTLPASSTDHFSDDDGRWYEGPANALADSGITKGCNAEGTIFCGEDNVTRGQMAAFLTRALGLPPASADYFDDDAGRFYEDSANRMYESGITRGCGTRSYCGENDVTRAEMATFLSRALGL